MSPLLTKNGKVLLIFFFAFKTGPAVPKKLFSGLYSILISKFLPSLKYLFIIKDL